MLVVVTGIVVVALVVAVLVLVTVAGTVLVEVVVAGMVLVEVTVIVVEGTIMNWAEASSLGPAFVETVTVY